MSPRTDYLRKKVQDIIDEGHRKGLDEGHRRGLDKGLALLAHQFERRLLRALTDDEKSTLRTRLDQVGPARLGDVVLDLDADALSRWLRDPGAR